MAQNIRIEIKNIEGREMLKIIEIEGSIDTATTAELDKTVSNVIEKIDKPGISIIFDFSKVNYINSTGLTKIMNYYMNIMRRGGVLKIANVAKNIYEIFNIVGATKIIKFYSTLNEALET